MPTIERERERDRLIVVDRGVAAEHAGRHTFRLLQRVAEAE
jgi:hypothetical protein